MIETRAPRSLVVETTPDGHYLEYASYLVKGLHERQREPVVLTSAAGWARLTHELDVPQTTAKIIVETEGELPPATILNFAVQAECTQVLVPSGDRFAYRLARLARWPSDIPVRLLLLRSPRVSPRVWWRDVLKRCALRLLEFRHPVVVLHLAGPGIESEGGFPVVHDVARWSRGDRRSYEALPSLDPVRFWFAVLGLLDERKNIAAIADALTLSGSASTFGLVLAGNSTPGALEACDQALRCFERAGGAVSILQRRLTDGEMDHLVESVDCVVCAHSNEGPSGIMLKAAAAGTRVVAAGADSLRTDSRVLDGASWVPLTETALASAFVDAKQRPRPAPEVFGSPTSFAREFIGDEAGNV